MGNGPKQKKPGSRSKLKKYKRACLTKHRAKDLDQIQDDIAKAKETGTDLSTMPFDDELPGGGQFYCFETNKHFTDNKALR
jgi:bud site selection protein 20